MYARTLCSACYLKARRSGKDLPARQAIRKRVMGSCAVESCTRKERPGTGGLCAAHYYRLHKLGDLHAAVPVRDRKDGAYLDSHGYVILPGGVREHRAVMAQVIGRPLRPFENVHHINGVRHDNRPENLELWTKPQLSGQRPADLAAWVVEQYPELVEAALLRADQMAFRLTS